MRDIPGARPPAPKDLVRIRDRLTFLYVERCTVHRDSNAITVTDARGVAHVPAAALSVLMIGPGVRVTHSAMSVLSESGATTVWVGENGVRYYAHGVPPSRSSRLLEAQAKAVSDPVLRASVARQMYLMRFQGENVENLSIPGQEAVSTELQTYRGAVGRSRIRSEQFRQFVSDQSSLVCIKFCAVWADSCSDSCAGVRLGFGFCPYR